MMFDNVLNVYLAEFQSFGESYLKTIANCVVPSRIVRMKYKQLPPIEELETKDKNELWAYANEVFPDETNQFKIHFCQIVYTIGSLI